MISVTQAQAASVAGTFDALICDPPYRDQVHVKATSNGTDGAGVRKRDLGFGSLNEHTLWSIADLASRTRRWSVVFSDMESGHIWRAVMPGEYIRSVPWARWSQPQLSGDRPPSGAELVSVFHPPGAKRWSGPGSLTHFDSKSLRGEDKFSCEKPLDIMLSLVSWFSDEGEHVVDPTCGSGTTGLACRILRRNCTLADIDGEAIRRAHEKIHAPISPRDEERCLRWLTYQYAWLGSYTPTTKAGKARYARALRDTELVYEAIDSMC